MDYFVVDNLGLSYKDVHELGIFLTSELVPSNVMIIKRNFPNVQYCTILMPRRTKLTGDPLANFVKTYVIGNCKHTFYRYPETYIIINSDYDKLEDVFDSGYYPDERGLLPRYDAGFMVALINLREFSANSSALTTPKKDTVADKVIDELKEIGSPLVRPDTCTPNVSPSKDPVNKESKPVDINRETTSPDLYWNSRREFPDIISRGEIRISKDYSNTSANRKTTLPDFTDDRLCVICIEEIKNYVLLPCRHLTCCQKCVTAIITCPACRAPIKEKMQIYL